jgi:catechol 2,3-dioxygenase-like lactoylglutathione lyase family enzyme
MPCIVDSRCVLAVRNLQESTRFYTEVLGFRRDPIEAEGWSFLTRDSFKVRLGECPNEKPASELGDHSYIVYLTVEGLDQLHQELSARGAPVISEPEDQPWGLREFSIRTPDGHRIRFGEPIPAL